MRLLRFDFGNEFRSIDLHPLFNVVSGLSPSQQRQLFGAIQTLASGSTLGVRGLVEHEGLLVELDGQSREPFAGAVTTAEVIVFADAKSTGASPLSFEDEVAFWQRREAIDTALLEEIRADLDAAAKWEVASLRHRIDPDAQLDGLDPSGPVQGNSHERDVDELRQAVVSSALKQVHATERYAISGDQAVLDLIKRWESFVQVRSEHEAHLAGLRAAIETTQQQWKQSSRMLAEARADARQASLSEDETARLEQLSDLDSEGGKKGLSDNERAEMRALLDKVGVSSWTEYALSRSSPRIPAAKLAALERIEQQVADDEKAVAAARHAASTDSISAQIGKTHAAMKDDARPYLGAVMPNDLGAGLEKLITQIDTAEWLRAVTQLHDTLSSNDLRPPYGLAADEILSWAEAWLAEQQADRSSLLEKPGRQDESHETTPQELRVSLEKAEARLVRHRRALTQIDGAERRAMLSQLRLDRVDRQMSERAATKTPQSAQEVLLLLEPVLRQMQADGGGRVPIVIAGAMEELDRAEINKVVRTLQRLSQKLQVLLLTDHEDARTAAVEFGLEKAGVANGLKALV